MVHVNCEGHGQLDLPSALVRSFMSHVTCAHGIGLVTSPPRCSPRAVPIIPSVNSLLLSLVTLKAWEAYWGCSHWIFSMSLMLIFNRMVRTFPDLQFFKDWYQSSGKKIVHKIRWVGKKFQNHPPKVETLLWLALRAPLRASEPRGARRAILVCQTLPGLPRAARPSAPLGVLPKNIFWSQHETNTGLASVSFARRSLARCREARGAAAKLLPPTIFDELNLFKFENGLALTRALRARRARPPEVAAFICSRARSVRKHLVRWRNGPQRKLSNLSSARSLLSHKGASSAHVIQLVVRSFACFQGSIKDAARDGPCAHGKRAW